MALLPDTRMAPCHSKTKFEDTNPYLCPRFIVIQ